MPVEFYKSCMDQKDLFKTTFFDHRQIATKVTVGLLWHSGFYREDFAVVLSQILIDFVDVEFLLKTLEIFIE